MFSLVRAVSFLLLSYFSADPVECLPQPSVGPQLNATIACQKLIQFFSNATLILSQNSEFCPH